MDRPLEGVRVVELAMWVAGPSTPAVLGDWGADVIKLEDPRTGDPIRGFVTRTMGDPNARIRPPFELDNRNKRSVAVDLRTADGHAFALNALTYMCFIYALWRIEVPEERLAPRASHFWRDLVEGYGYALRDPGIGKMFMLLIVTTVAIRGFVEMFPGFADAVFDRGPQGLAWLTATVGLGAVVGGLYMLQRNSLSGLATLVIRATLVMAVALAGFTATTNYWLALVCVFIGGIAMCATGIGAQTLIQTSTTPAMRGRVMGFYGMIFRAGPSLNALLLGAFSEHFGLRLPVFAGALVCVVGWMWIRPRKNWPGPLR